MSSEVLGKPQGEDQAWTQFRFVDGSQVIVYWDGGHSVAGMHGGSDMVTIYQPGGRRSYIPWHRIVRIDHYEGQA